LTATTSKRPQTAPTSILFTNPTKAPTAPITTPPTKAPTAPTTTPIKATTPTTTDSDTDDNNDNNNDSNNKNNNNSNNKNNNSTATNPSSTANRFACLSNDDDSTPPEPYDQRDYLAEQTRGARRLNDRASRFVPTCTSTKCIKKLYPVPPCGFITE
jgi:hypothetical protein